MAAGKGLINSDARADWPARLNTALLAASTRGACLPTRLSRRGLNVATVVPFGSA